MSDRNQAPQVPLWFLLAVMAMMGLTAAGFLFLGTRLAPGAIMPQEQMKLMDLAYAHIQRNYVDALGPEESEDLVHKAISGLVRGLDDRYSQYIPPERVTRFDESNSGVYSGVGFVMEPKGDQITVYFPFPGGPAEREGLKVGDRIVAIVTLREEDGEYVEVETTRVEDLVDSGIEDPDQREGKLTRAAQKLIKGKAGTPVRLLVQREEKTFPVTITRDEVPSPSVKWAHLLDPETGIAYVHVAGFVRHSATEMDRALENLVRTTNDGRKLRGLVLDLRFNQGGVLDTCLEVTNRFLRKGVIVTLNKGESRSSTKVGEHRAEPEKCTFPELPLAILINNRSASASEVLAGALQDHGRAVVVGTRSFGKALVQSIYRLSPEARLKITTAEYRTPKGRNIHRGKKKKDNPRWGIHPDKKVQIPQEVRDAIHRALAQHEVPEKYRAEAEALAKRLGITVQKPLSPEQDPQLAAAFEEIRKLVAEQGR